MQPHGAIMALYGAIMNLLLWTGEWQLVFCMGCRDDLNGKIRIKGNLDEPKNVLSTEDRRALCVLR